MKIYKYSKEDNWWYGLSVRAANCLQNNITFKNEKSYFFKNYS